MDDAFHTVEPSVIASATAPRAVVPADPPEAVEVSRADDRAAADGFGEREATGSHRSRRPRRARVDLRVRHGVAASGR